MGFLSVPGLPGPNYGNSIMLGGSAGMLNPYQGMGIPGQDMAHLGMGAFDLSAYNPQLVSFYVYCIKCL